MTPLRRILAFDLKGMWSLVLWITRRRDVPAGAVAVPYAREYPAPVMMFLFAVVAEAVATDVLLRALDAPRGLRLPLLVVDAYGILIVLAIAASIVTRPHVVAADELRIRWGVFFDLRIPRTAIAAVRVTRNDNEHGTVKLDGDRLAVATASRTNVVVELTGPVAVVRPLGRRGVARTVRFFADRPDAAIAALTATEAAGARDDPSARTI